MREKEANEMNECTFAPQLVTKKRPKSRANANVEHSPEYTSRINRPESSIMTSKMAASHRSRGEESNGPSQSMTARSRKTNNVGN